MNIPAMDTVKNIATNFAIATGSAFMGMVTVNYIEYFMQTVPAFRNLSNCLESNTSEIECSAEFGKYSLLVLDNQVDRVFQTLFLPIIIGATISAAGYGIGKAKAYITQPSLEKQARQIVTEIKEEIKNELPPGKGLKKEEWLEKFTEKLEKKNLNTGLRSACITYFEQRLELAFPKEKTS